MVGEFSYLFIIHYSFLIFHYFWGYSSDGRAFGSHSKGQGFNSPYLHFFIALHKFAGLFSLQFNKKIGRNNKVISAFLLLVIPQSF